MSARPVGIVACVLALATAIAVCRWQEAEAVSLARRHLGFFAGLDVPAKTRGLVFQRAALASGDTLPIYGSSELYCCGSPYRPTQLFAGLPTGFRAVAFGHIGMGDLLFLQSFGALGRELAGKKVVVSESPFWFFGSEAATRPAYAANFSREIAYAFTFGAPISRALRERVARRMVAYPETLRDDPLLRTALQSLADPTPLHRTVYALLAPLGRLEAWTLEAREAMETAHFIRTRRQLCPEPPAAPRSLDWVQLAAHATGIVERRDTTNPFGFPNGVFRRYRHKRRIDEAALARWRAGENNHDGRALPRPKAWEADLAHSAAWRDLRLELHVLRELAAEPLVVSPPLDGAYADYTERSRRERERYYRRYTRTVARADVAWVDFHAHDEDRDFLTDPGSHYSPRGWIFVNRALDGFWHDEPVADTRATLAMLDHRVPGPVGARAP